MEYITENANDDKKNPDKKSYPDKKFVKIYDPTGVGLTTSFAGAVASSSTGALDSVLTDGLDSALPVGFDFFTMIYPTFL